MEENEIGTVIVNCAVQLHQALGPGLLETVYEVTLARRLEKAGPSVAGQVGIPITFEGEDFEVGFRADLIVEGLVIVELKSVERVNPAHKKQLLTYPSTLGKRQKQLMQTKLMTMWSVLCFLSVGIVRSEDEAPTLQFDGRFPSAWSDRKDGTTALLFIGKMTWEYRDPHGRGSLTAESNQVTVEAGSDTEYLLFYSDSKEPLRMSPKDITPILQDIMMNNITRAYAVDPVVRPQERGRLTVSARRFVFHTSSASGRKSAEPEQQEDKPNKSE